MSWLSSLSTLALVLACTRENPAFEGGLADEASEGEDSTTLASEDESETSASECIFDPGADLKITLPFPCVPNNEQEQRYEWYFKVVERTPTGWRGGICTDMNDSTCSGECPTDTPQEVELGPFDLDSLEGMAGAGSCLHIKAAQADPEIESCNFDAVGIWYEGGPIVIASNGTALIGEALADAGGIVIEPKLVEDPPCECVADCCEVPPGDYGFDISDQYIPVGAATNLLEFPSYVLHPLAAYNPTGCVDDMRQVWALTFDTTP